MANRYLPGDAPRALWMRMDSARILKRFFFCEQALVVGQAGWLAAIAPFEIKTTLPQLFWEDSLTGHALRERVFELRFPNRMMEVGEDSPLVSVFAESIHAPTAAAFVLALARVLKPALLAGYRQYLGHADPIADGPTVRFLGQAIADKETHIERLDRFAAELLAQASAEERAAAQAWASAVGQSLAQVGGVSIEAPTPLTGELRWPGRRTFQVAEPPARDPRFHRCRFYWPDIVDPEFPYGEGLSLQLRSAVSHLNEVWAVETGGAMLCALAETLGWEFVLDAARWTYDESRHARMGYERLRGWGFRPDEMPLGTYIADSGRGRDPVIWIGMLSYFETKNIGKKTQRAKVFAEYRDHVSQHDMEFDWADETIHAHLGTRWLGALHQLSPGTVPDIDSLRDRCNRLVSEVIRSATEAERVTIRRVANALIDKAGRLSATVANPDGSHG